jgi:antitoxin HigA-1
MQNNIFILKGIHPGAILERELNKRNFSQRKFALSIGEHPQTICAIIKGRRDMNIPLSLKIEQALKIQEGYFMTLQVYYSIKELKNKEQSKSHPNLALIRRALFWDTNIEKINWVQQKKVIIKRVFERGNDQEKSEILRFYGNQTVEEILELLDRTKEHVQPK